MLFHTHTQRHFKMWLLFQTFNNIQLGHLQRENIWAQRLHKFLGFSRANLKYCLTVIRALWTIINKIYVLFALKQISKCVLAVLPKWFFFSCFECLFWVMHGIIGKQNDSYTFMLKKPLYFYFLLDTFELHCTNIT